MHNLTSEYNREKLTVRDSFGSSAEAQSPFGKFVSKQVCSYRNKCEIFETQQSLYGELHVPSDDDETASYCKSAIKEVGKAIESGDVLSQDRLVEIKAGLDDVRESAEARIEEAEAEKAEKRAEAAKRQEEDERKRSDESIEASKRAEDAEAEKREAEEKQKQNEAEADEFVKDFLAVEEEDDRTAMLEDLKADSEEVYEIAQSKLKELKEAAAGDKGDEKVKREAPPVEETKKELDETGGVSTSPVSNGSPEGEKPDKVPSVQVTGGKNDPAESKSEGKTSEEKSDEGNDSGEKAKTEAKPQKKIAKKKPATKKAVPKNS